MCNVDERDRLEIRKNDSAGTYQLINLSLSSVSLCLFLSSARWWLYRIRVCIGIGIGIGIGNW